MSASSVYSSLKIVQVCTSRAWGGMEMHHVELSREQYARGADVQVICARDSRTAHALAETDLKDRCHFWPPAGYFQPAVILRARRFFRQLKPDVIHVHYSRDLWWLVPALIFLPQSVLVLSKHIGTQKPKRDFLHRFLYSRVDRLIAISRVIRKNIIATHPVPERKVVLVHHGIDLERYAPEKIDRISVREKLGYTQDHFVIGITGRLQPSKGYLELLAAAQRLRTDYPENRYLLVGEASVGDSRQANEVYRFIEEKGQTDIVQCTGFRRDIPEMLAAMDLFVFPSHAEAFGLVVIEAMAMAKAIIASNSDGIPDIINDGITGLLVPPRSVEPLTRAIRRLRNDAGLRERLGRHARSRAQEYFTTDRMMKNLLQVYQNALAERSRHG